MNQKLGSKLFPNFKSCMQVNRKVLTVLLREVQAFPDCVLRFLEGKGKKNGGLVLRFRKSPDITAVISDLSVRMTITYKQISSFRILCQAHNPNHVCPGPSKLSNLGGHRSDFKFDWILRKHM